MITEKALIKAIKGKRLLIDSNIIIYLTDAIKPFASLSQRLFYLVESGEAEAVISILSIAEVMQGPLRQGSGELAVTARDYLTNFPNCICQSVTIGVLEKVGTDSNIKWDNLRTIDSLIIASGLVNDVQLFISNDSHFKAALPANQLLTFT